MAVVLSPWPAATSVATRAAAVARLSAAVAGRTIGEDGTADADATNHLGEVASAMVEREAAGAPQPVKNEAVIRIAGYLAGADYGGIESEAIGPRSVTYSRNHGLAFRHSGAKALLAPWRVRRAGAIG